MGISPRVLLPEFWGEAVKLVVSTGRPVEPHRARQRRDRERTGRVARRREDRVHLARSKAEFRCAVVVSASSQHRDPGASRKAVARNPVTASVRLNNWAWR